MDSWQKYLTNIIALHSRGKHIEKTLNFTRIFDKDMSAGRVVELIARAEEVKGLYTKAYRMCKLLLDSQSKDNTTDIRGIHNTIESSLRRVGDILKILNTKATKWGLGPNEEFLGGNEMDWYEPETLRTPLDMASSNDMSYVFDEVDEDAYLKEDIKKTLKSLSDIVDYMETPTLAKIKKDLDKLMRE
jgi:hypothetical protein